MLLHPLKDPVPLPLAARGRAILGPLDDVSHAEALDLACRSLVGVLAARPRFEDSTKDQASYNTLCQEVEQWVKRELQPLRFREAKGRLVEWCAFAAGCTPRSSSSASSHRSALSRGRSGIKCESCAREQPGQDQMGPEREIRVQADQSEAAWV